MHHAHTAGSDKKVSGSHDADEPMLIPGITSALGVAETTPGSGKGTPAASPSGHLGGNNKAGMEEGKYKERIAKELEALDPATSSERAQELLRLSGGDFNSKEGSDAGDSSDDDPASKAAPVPQQEQEQA